MNKTSSQKSNSIKNTQNKNKKLGEALRKNLLRRKKIDNQKHHLLNLNNQRQN